MSENRMEGRSTRGTGATRITCHISVDLNRIGSESAPLFHLASAHPPSRHISIDLICSPYSSARRPPRHPQTAGSASVSALSAAPADPRSRHAHAQPGGGGGGDKQWVLHQPGGWEEGSRYHRGDEISDGPGALLTNRQLRGSSMDGAAWSEVIMGPRHTPRIAIDAVRMALAISAAVLLPPPPSPLVSTWPPFPTHAHTLQPLPLRCHRTRTTVSARMTAARLAMSRPSLAANFWKVDSAMLASLPFLISHASRKGFSRSCQRRAAVWGRIQRFL